MKRLIIVLVLLVAFVLGAIYFLQRSLKEKENSLAGAKPIIIGFSMGVTREDRWFKDRDFFVEKAEELGAVVSVTMSDYDVEKQISQIKNLVSQGAEVIVVIPSDSEKIGSAIGEARRAGVKIIAYDRLISNSDLDFYISFDNEEVGRLQARSILARAGSGNFAYIGGSPADNNSYLLKAGTMEVLDPLIAAGDINLVIDTFTDGWKPEEAYKAMKEYLAAGNSLDAVIAANDGTASGVIQALVENGLDGRIPVSGQDAELSALRRIIAGTQTSSVYKSIGNLAHQAAIAAVAMARDDALEITGYIDNGETRVPAYLLDPVLVTRDNIQETVIKDGFHSYEEVYGEKVEE